MVSSFNRLPKNWICGQSQCMVSKDSTYRCVSKIPGTLQITCQWGRRTAYIRILRIISLRRNQYHGSFRTVGGPHYLCKLVMYPRSYRWWLLTKIGVEKYHTGPIILYYLISFKKASKDNKANSCRRDDPDIAYLESWVDDNPAKVPPR